MARRDRFTGKVALVTGAASGIGRTTAIAFAAEGARVATLDRGEAAMRDTAAAVGGEVLSIACDLAEPDQVEAAVTRVVATFGRLDIAFNEAMEHAIVASTDCEVARVQAM